MMMRHFAVCSFKMDVFLRCAAPGCWALTAQQRNTDLYADNLINGFKNPGAQVIFSLHCTNLNTAEIIPGLQRAFFCFVQKEILAIENINSSAYNHGTECIGAVYSEVQVRHETSTMVRVRC